MLYVQIQTASTTCWWKVKTSKNKAKTLQSISDTSVCIAKRSLPETVDTPMYRRHISEEELILIGKLLVEKVGNRVMPRITGLTPITISRVIDAITLHAAGFNALMAGKAGVGVVELDGMWTFVKNKKTWTKE
ncbi:MAG: hypothetical protein U9N36_10290 [Euryarchaeota archaeon]|nr:hypothetical protein [Euryarchaeota archaeon]